MAAGSGVAVGKTRSVGGGARVACGDGVGGAGSSEQAARGKISVTQMPNLSQRT
jgi:hypothetical protein